MENTIRQLEDRVKKLEANQLGVIMTANADTNVYRSLLRTLVSQGISTGIGTSNPKLSCIVDIASTSKAFRLPCMTTTQRDAITSPAEGFLIYNLTTHVLNHYNGSAWAAV